MWASFTATGASTSWPRTSTCQTWEATNQLFGLAPRFKGWLKESHHRLKDLFLALMQKDVDDGSYSWTPLYSKQVQVLDDAKAAVELVSDRDARINFMALYEARV